MRQIINWVPFCMAVLFSGDIWFNEILSVKIEMILYAFASWIYMKQTTNSNFLKDDNLTIFVLFTVWITIDTLFLNHFSNNNLFLQFIFFAFGTACLCSSCDFYTFRNKILKVLSVIMLCSIIVQIGHDYIGLFPHRLVTMRGFPRYMSAYFFQTIWGVGNNRMSSIYWEPGQCQIVITYVLCLFLDELRNISNIRNWLKKFAIPIIALLCTKSSMGYIVLCLLIIYIFIFSDIVRKHKSLIPLSLIMGFLMALYLFRGDVIQDKLAQRDATERNSFTIRLADNLAMIEVSKEKPIIGFGIGSEIAEDHLSINGDSTSSNGWLKTAVWLGYPFVLWLIFLMYRGIRRIERSKMISVIILFILFLSQCNESAIYYPYIYMYIFVFKSYPNVNYAIS